MPEIVETRSAGDCSARIDPMKMEQRTATAKRLMPVRLGRCRDFIFFSVRCLDGKLREVLNLFVQSFGFRLRENLLKARIVPERIEHWIEPKQRGSERHARSQCALGRYR